MRTTTVVVGAVMVCLSLSMTARAGYDAPDVPYQPSFSTERSQSDATRIITPARLHPEVAVSRSLSAQPVHPYLVELQFAGSGSRMSTYIDPMRKLDGEGQFDEDHSIVKAQRLYRSLAGISTQELNAANRLRMAYQHIGPAKVYPRVIRRVPQVAMDEAAVMDQAQVVPVSQPAADSGARVIRRDRTEPKIQRRGLRLWRVPIMPAPTPKPASGKLVMADK